MITVNGHSYHKARTRISYDHIPSQTILKNSYARLVRVQLEKKGERVAYIMGAGDEIPESLERIGYQVDILPPSSVTLQRLKSYDALVTGIRAYNTVDALRFLQLILFDYVEQGGTMSVQYKTKDGLVNVLMATTPPQLSPPT